MVTFPAQEQHLCVPIGIKDDGLTEAQETFSVHLANYEPLLDDIHVTSNSAIVTIADCKFNC